MEIAAVPPFLQPKIRRPNKPFFSGRSRLADEVVYEGADLGSLLITACADYPFFVVRLFIATKRRSIFIQSNPCTDGIREIIFPSGFCDGKRLFADQANGHFAEGERRDSLLRRCSGKSVKKFRRSQEDVSSGSEKAGERTIRFKTSRQKTGCRALRVRATSGASAPARARHETSTHTVYDRNSTEETGK